MDRRNFIRTVGATGVIVSLNPALALNNNSAELATDPLLDLFRSPHGQAGLSVMWHWTGGVVTREGITFDLEGMAASGIDTVMWFAFPAGPSAVDGLQPIEPLTPEWMALYDHTVEEARRLGLKLAPHAGVTWTPAGGPWITPELSQQVFVWSELKVDSTTAQPIRIDKPQRPPVANFGGGGALSAQAPAPEWENYYRDLGVIAFPIPADWRRTSVTEKAIATSSWHTQPLPGLTDPENLKPVIETDQAGWVEFSFAEPFLLRAVTVTSGPGRGQRTAGLQTAAFNLPAHTLRVEASDDGQTYREIARLDPMWHGWQSSINTLTHSVRETKARHFRFYYDPQPQTCYDDHLPQGTYRGTPFAAGQPSPDASPRTLPNAPLQLAHMVLSSTPAVHHLPGKNGSLWGKSRRVTDQELPTHACIPLASLVDLTGKMDDTGTLRGWHPASGDWQVMRFGHMSQLKRNWTGYECDKFSAAAAELQFNGWVQRLRSRSAAAAEVIQLLETDSWECGSQNWSANFAAEFRERRGYALQNYLPAMAGVPLESASVTENFLQDARRTMADCVSDNFFGTMHRLCAEHGMMLSSEAVSPVMISDNLQVFKNTDMPGGEFWVRTWQNWKPLDIKDAVSAARIYGKPIVTAESFTGGGWEDHPYALKALGDHNYAQGINRTILHCWAEQYHPDRDPGIAGPGTPFHALNTWWQPGQAWRDYMKRCEALLQTGIPVADFLYFIGEDVPNRALLPARDGTCFRMEPELPAGYCYDSINRDGLLHHATLVGGSIQLGIGTRYRVLVLPPETTMSLAVAEKVREFVRGGVLVLGPAPVASCTLEDHDPAGRKLSAIVQQIWQSNSTASKAVVHPTAHLSQRLQQAHMQPDVLFDNLRDRSSGTPIVVNAAETRAVNPTLDGDNRRGWGMEFQHRRDGEREIYYLSNQEVVGVAMDVSFRVSGKTPYLWHPETGDVHEVVLYREHEGRTVLPMRFDPAEAVFIVFEPHHPGRPIATQISGAQELELRRSDNSLFGQTFASGTWQITLNTGQIENVSAQVPPPLPITQPWTVTFPSRNSKQGPEIVSLNPGPWTLHEDADIRHFSGTAIYELLFVLPSSLQQPDLQLWLDLGDVANLGHVHINGKDLGVVWKPPYMLNVTGTMVPGENHIAIAVTNTWINRLIGDANEPETTRALASGKTMFGTPLSVSSPLLPAGLLGPAFLRSRRRIAVSTHAVA